MTTLAKRIEALEQEKPVSIGPFFIHLIGLDTKDSEIERITKGNQEWQRQPGESVQDLKDRAMREVPPPKPNTSTLFVCY